MTARFVAAADWPTDSSGLPLLLSAAADGNLRLWSLQTRRVISSVDAHAGSSVLAVQALSNSRVLTQGRDGFVRLWDARGGFSAPVRQLSTQSYNFCQFACSAGLVGWSSSSLEATENDAAAGADADALPPDLDSGAPLLVLPSDDANELRMWDLRARAPVRTLSPATDVGKAGMCMCARFARGDSLLLSGWEDGSLHVFDLRGTSPPRARRLHAEPLLSLDVDASGTHALSGAADCKLCITPLGEAGAATPPPIHQLSIPPTNEAAESGGISSVSVRPDGRIFAAGGWDRRVRLWQWRKWKPLAVLRLHTATVHAVTFSPCSKWLASASGDRTIALWTLFPPRSPSGSQG